MKAAIKTIACTIAIYVALSFCTDSNDEQNNTNDELPIMDSRVVSYKRLNECFSTDCFGLNDGEHYGFVVDKDSFELSDGSFVTGRDILKSWFPPNIFDNEQAKPECNYFAIYLGPTSSSFLNYWILSQEMILYNIKPNFAKTVNCPFSADVIYHIMLVCDNTDDGNLKDKIDLNSIQSYTDPNWDCEKENVRSEDVFF